MRGGRQKQGYTIVEVMIFLAISGVMFIIAAGFINGKQAKSEFRQGMNDINSQIQNTINDVSNGFYPSNGNFNCTVSGTGAPTLSTTGQEQGANKGCVFMGKVMQFPVGGTSYDIYSVIGRQFKPDAAGLSAETLIPPETFAEALPVSGTAAGINYLTQRQTLKWGMQVERMLSTSTNNPIDAFGFFSGFSTSDSDKLESGAAASILVAIPQVPPGNVPAQIAGPALRNLTPANAYFGSGIVICFRGDNNQFGRLNIGSDDDNSVTSGSYQKLSTHIQISTGARTGACVTS